MRASGAERVRIPTPTKSYGRLGVLAVGLVVVAVVVSTSVPAAAGAAPSFGSGTHIAPYRGVVTSWYNATSVTTCATSRVTHPYLFRASVGRATLGTAASARACRTLPAQAPIGVQVYHDLFVDLPVTLRGGSHTFAINWSVSIAAASAFNASKGCPRAPIPHRGVNYQDCFLSGGGTFSTESRLFGANGAYLGYGGTRTPLTFQAYWSNGSACYANRTCTFSNYTYTSAAYYNGTVNYTTNMTVSAGALRGQHGHFELQLQLDSDEYAYVSYGPAAPPLGTWATASLHIGVRIVSVTIT